jgi:hypothetical protein
LQRFHVEWQGKSSQKGKKITRYFQKSKKNFGKSLFSLLIALVAGSEKNVKLFIKIYHKITFLIYNAKISDNNAESGKVPRMLAAFPR